MSSNPANCSHALGQPGRRCRGQRTTTTGSSRPSEVLRVFFLAGLLYMGASVVAGVAYALTGSDRLHWLALHLLAVLGRIRRFAVAMPAPRPVRDGALTAAAGAGLSTLALSYVPGLAPLSGPASAVTLVVAAMLALQVLVLALHAVARTAS